jgi:hypothetical protein
MWLITAALAIIAILIAYRLHKQRPVCYGNYIPHLASVKDCDRCGYYSKCKGE